MVKKTSKYLVTSFIICFSINSFASFHVSLLQPSSTKVCNKTLSNKYTFTKTAHFDINNLKNSLLLPQQYQPAVSRFNLKTVHKYTGYGAIVFAGLAAITNSNRSTHYTTAYLATGCAATAVLTGFIKYGSFINFKRGILQKPNFHMLLGSAGALFCASSIISADTGSFSNHSGLGVTGGILMFTSFLTIKFNIF